MTRINTGRSIFALLALFFIGNGLILMFSPTSLLDHMLLGSVGSASELSSIRALMGGTIFATWTSVLLGAIKTNVNYIYVGFINLLSVIAARLAGYVVDGPYPEFVAITTPTVVFFVLMLIAYRLMAGSTD